jgi:threonine dehydratase
MPEISLEEIRATAALIAPYVVETPVHSWSGREIVELVGANTEIVLKLELFQHTGTFKPRGALSQMLRLSSEERRRGVTAVSAGNHAIAVAYAASVLDMDAKVVMVSTANPARLASARAFGAEVLLAVDGPSAFAMVEKIASDEARTLIHPFEGRNVSLGTATLGVEIAEQAGALDVLIVAIGGGGLASGVAAAVKLIHPECRIYGVEPAGADSMRRSFAAGAPQRLEHTSTIADSLAPPMALPFSFAMCRDNLDGLVTVDDGELRRAMALLYREMKLVVEPAGAAAVAAAIGPLREVVEGRRIGIVICGSNIDIGTFHDHIRDAPMDVARLS